MIPNYPSCDCPSDLSESENWSFTGLPLPVQQHLNSGEQCSKLIMNDSYLLFQSSLSPDSYGYHGLCPNHFLMVTHYSILSFTTVPLQMLFFSAWNFHLSLYGSPSLSSMRRPPCLQLASVGRAKSFVSPRIIIYHIHIYSITYSIIGSCLVFPLDCEQILLSYSYFFCLQCLAHSKKLVCVC